MEKNLALSATLDFIFKKLNIINFITMWGNKFCMKRKYTQTIKEPS